MKNFKIIILTLLLSGCINRTGSLIETPNKPLINIDEDIASQIDVEAKSEKVFIQNRSIKPINISYKFFWFDEKGTSQLNNTKWHNLHIKPQQEQQIVVIKPTQQSYNYRIYLRHK